MNDSSRLGWRLALLLAVVLSLHQSVAAATNLYSTQFEAAEGFNPTNDLAGQNGWTNYLTGGNGLVDYYVGYGQSAYIGYWPPASYDGLYLWRPVNFSPTNYPIVTFTVDLAIIDSTNNIYDEFRWSVYNTNQIRLFSLGIDNNDYVNGLIAVYYQLDNGVFTNTGWGIENGPIYALEIQMNFTSNRWSAWLGPAQVVTNALITTTNSPLSLGGVRAVWLPHSTNGAGDNFMLFDNYSLTADVLPQTIPKLQPPVFLGGGQHRVRVLGEAGKRYALEGGTNLVDWTSLKTNLVTSSGYFDHTNTTGNAAKWFYRARWVP